MSVLMIGATELKEIDRLVRFAKDNVVPWAITKDAAMPMSAEMKLKDRKPGAERPPSQHIVLGNVRVAYSHEEQPAGIFRHLSASVRRPGRTPNPFVMAVICEAFGFSAALCSVLSEPTTSHEPVAEAGIWLEEFDPGHHAVNVIERIAS